MRKTTFRQILGKWADDFRNPVARIRWVLEIEFAGNQRRMAEKLGVSQALISKVLRKERTPGSKLLTAIADNLQFDRVWVMTGNGQPLGEKAAAFRWVPVVNEPLSGAPLENREKIIEFEPTLEDRVTANSYWLELSESAITPALTNYALLAGDRLLVEPVSLPEHDLKSPLSRVLAVVVLPDAETASLAVIDSFDARSESIRIADTGSTHRSAKSSPQKRMPGRVSTSQNLSVRSDNAAIPVECLLGLCIRLERTLVVF